MLSSLHLSVCILCMAYTVYSVHVYVLRWYAISIVRTRVLLQVCIRLLPCILPKHTWFSVHSALFQSESCEITFVVRTIMFCHYFVIGRARMCTLRTTCVWEDTRQPVERRSECRTAHTYTLATALTPTARSTAGSTNLVRTNGTGTGTKNISETHYTCTYVMVRPR
jgi:hypothetical protein